MGYGLKDFNRDVFGPPLTEGMGLGEPVLKELADHVTPGRGSERLETAAGTRLGGAYRKRRRG